MTWLGYIQVPRVLLPLFCCTFFFFFFNLTYSRWTSSLPSCLLSLRIFPSLPGSRLTIFYRDASSTLLQLVNQWLNLHYCLSLSWCPCMVINVSVQYNGGFLPDIILLTLCYCYHRGTRLNAMKSFCPYSSLSSKPKNVLTFSPLIG